MTLFVVVSEIYDSYDIHGIFSTRTAADAAVRVVGLRLPTSRATLSVCELEAERLYDNGKMVGDDTASSFWTAG